MIKRKFESTKKSIVYNGSHKTIRRFFRGNFAGKVGMSWGGITRGEMSDIDDGGMEAANHLAMYLPMQQPCMICICTPEPKAQFLKM